MLTVTQGFNSSRRALRISLATLGCVVGTVLLCGSASAAPQVPVWNISQYTAPTVVPEGGEGTLVIELENVGAAESTGPVEVTAALPPGMVATSAGNAQGYWGCPEAAGKTMIECNKFPWMPNVQPGNQAPFIHVGFKADPSAAPVSSSVASVSGGGAKEQTSLNSIVVGEPTSAPGIDEFRGWLAKPDGTSANQAGDHPDFTTDLHFNTIIRSESGTVDTPYDFKDVDVELPPGLIGDPSVGSKCEEGELTPAAANGVALCPAESQVGVARLTFANGPELLEPYPLAIYNMRAPFGAPARFAFNYHETIISFQPKVRADGDYGITAHVGGASQSLATLGARVTLWGVPADPAHNALRWAPGEFSSGATSTAPLKPFITTPTSCTGEALSFHVRSNTWEFPSLYDEKSFDTDFEGNPIKMEGCNQLDFSPQIEARPTTNVADSPTGLDVDLSVPQNDDPNGLAEAHLKDAALTFPAGMTVNPASAQGLDACSPAQVGLVSPVGQAPARFDEAEVSCPDASKLGTVAIETPLLPEPLQGTIYLASQSQNPFNSLLALYIVVKDPQTGITIKLAGHPVADPSTGQLTVSFDQNPQLPFAHLRVNLFNGPRAALKTPMSCGQFTTTSTLVPWSSPEGANATPSDSFGIVSGANNAPCLKTEAEAPNTPSFSAGTADSTAGAYTPFVLKVVRADGTAPIKAIDATLPKGLLGKLAGIAYCPDAALAAAAGKSGKAEQASASCPASSRLGSVTVGAGAGSNPLYVGGTAYLAGPYKGAPLSLAIVTPAVAGPFDLGTVVVRNALYVDPETAQIHAVSDPIPTILQGIPLDIRSIAVNMDRPSFTLNPTSCEPTSVLGGATSVFSQTTSLSDRFQVGGCAALGFKPALAIDLKGGTKRSEYPALKATLKARAGDANIGKAVVSLPHSEFLAQSHIKTICTRVQFAANACPPGSIYGKARAFSPLIDQPLEGPVYLRSSSNPLPDLVADLNGQIRVALVGRIDSVKGGIRTSFESVPDAPVSKFVLEMAGGKKGLLENSRNLCKTVNKADVDLTGQNGKASESTPVVSNDCKVKKKHKKSKKSKKHKSAKPGSRH